MVPPLVDPGEGGIGFKDIWDILHDSCPGDSSICAVDVGCDPPHGADPGGGSNTDW